MLNGFIRQDVGKAQVAPIDDNQSLTFTERLNARGTWEMNVGYGTITSDALLAVTGPGIIVRWGDNTILSGCATAIRRRDSDVLTVVGIDDTGLLGDRIIEPNPGSLALTPNAFDVRTGAVSTVLRQFIDVNMGPGAHADRRVSDFTLAADPAVGATITINGRFQQLSELVFNQANAAGLVFRILQNSSNGLVGEFKEQTLVGGQVFATEGFNTVSFESTSKAALATYVLAGGDGTGTSRTTTRTEAAMTGRFAGRRIETFLDQRSETSTAVLNTKSDELLADTSDAISLRVDVEGTEAFNYAVGDLVKVQIEGEQFTLPIYETKTDIEPDSIVRQLSIGDRDGTDSTAGLARLANRSNNRIRTIERI